MFVKVNETLLNQAQWMERLRAGDEKAFKEIYDHYHSRLFYFSLRFMGREEAAKEIVQEAFIRLWTYRDRIDSSLSLQGYLYTIARNLNFKSLQQRARDMAFKEEMVYRSANQHHNSEDEIIYGEYLRIAEDAVEQLSPHRKLVYRMAWKDGMSVHEISRDLQISVSTVKNHLAEARKNIKEHLLLKADLSTGLVVFMYVSIP